VTPRAVVFDLGGVVLGSPLHAIAAFEREAGLPPGCANRTVAETAPHGAWSRLERGELPMEDFFAAFEAECAERGHALSARKLFERMAAAAEPRPEMLVAIGAIRRRGLGTAALTNNWGEGDGTGALAEHFDVFFESRVLGLRKPDPAIYRHACRELRVEPPEAVFLDDIGANLKPARALGMHTIKVEEPAQALKQLEAVLGFPVREG